MSRRKNTKRKSSNRKRLRRKRILRFLLFILVAVLGYLFVFKTDVFHIKNIRVVGNEKLSYEDVVRASLCTKGENIFKISKKIGEESLNRLSYIKSSKIRRKLPDQIIIEIEERREKAIIPYIGSFIYIDQEGYILDVKENRKEGLPQIFGLDLKEPKIGENLFDLLKRKDISEFILFSDGSGLLSLMKYINFSDNKNTILELNDGIKVAFGPLDNVKYKLSFLYKILDDIEKKDINVKQILLNKGDNPIVVTDGK